MSAEGVEAKLARLDERMNTVEKGVANFRDFQAEMRDFVSRCDEREDGRQANEEARNKRNDRRLNIIIALLTLLGVVIAVLQVMHK